MNKSEQKYKITGGYVELKNPSTGEILARQEIAPSDKKFIMKDGALVPKEEKNDNN